MALTKYTASTAIIAALDDLPNATGGLTAAQLKAKFDENPAAFKTFVNALIDELEATTDGSSGADQIGATSITGLTGSTVQALIESLKTYADNLSMGAVADGAVTNAKLATDVKVGSLADLNTTTKTSVVAAINEHLADTTTHGVTGVIVGTSDEQTLSNKTLTAPTIAGTEAQLFLKETDASTDNKLWDTLVQNTDLKMRLLNDANTNATNWLEVSRTGMTVDYVLFPNSPVKIKTIGIFVGTGSPEGSVTAVTGSLYLRTDGSTTTTLYVKTSGTGNTGWTAK